MFISAFIIDDFSKVSDKAIMSLGFLLISKRNESILGSRLLIFR